MLAVGMDLGGRSARFLIIEKGEEIARWRMKIDVYGKELLSVLVYSIESKIIELGINKADVESIVMGVPGTVNPNKGEVIGAYNLKWDAATPVGATFKAAFPNAKVIVENDANVAALGEWEYGCGKGTKQFMLVTLGTGVGSGLILNGELYFGKGRAGEIGHMTVHGLATTCSCGKKGCLETIASARGVEALARQRAKTSQDDSTLVKKLRQGEDVACDDLFQAAQAGNPFARAVCEESMSILGESLGNIANTLDLEVIAIGGGVSLAGDYLLSLIEPSFRESLFPPLRPLVKLEIAKLNADAGLLGTLTLV